MRKSENYKKPIIGVTTLGSTTECALRFKKCMEEIGYEVVVFHSNGIGGKTMEELIKQGLIQGVFDLSTNEIVDHIYGGWADAGSKRLEMAGTMGIPQLIAPGNIDYTMYTSPVNIPRRFKGRPYHSHGPTIYILRMQKKEIIKVAQVMAKKLNKARGPTGVIIPLKGFSSLDKLDKEIFFDTEANFAFIEALKEKIRPDIRVIEVDAHITDSSFSGEAVTIFSELMSQRNKIADSRKITEVS